MTGRAVGGQVSRVEYVPAGQPQGVVVLDDAAVERATTALLEDSGLPPYGNYRATIERRVRLAFAAAAGRGE
jgi:hypothetical protein